MRNTGLDRMYVMSKIVSREFCYISPIATEISPHFKYLNIGLSTTSKENIVLQIIEYIEILALRRNMDKKRFFQIISKKKLPLPRNVDI